MVELDDDEALLIEGGVTVRLAAHPAARASEAGRAVLPRVVPLSRAGRAAQFVKVARLLAVVQDDLLVEIA